MLKQCGFITLALATLMSAAPCLADDLAVQQEAHGRDYVTGGIGAEEVEAMASFQKQFNLYFLFSEGKVGRVIDDIRISISDNKNQTVFALDHAAPRLLLNLPSGRYQVTASYLGQEQRYRFTHDANKPQRIILNWKNTDEEANALPSAEAPETDE